MSGPGQKRGKAQKRSETLLQYLLKIEDNICYNLKLNVYLYALGSAGKETKSFCYAYGNKHCVIHNKRDKCLEIRLN